MKTTKSKGFQNIIILFLVLKLTNQIDWSCG
jgi:hypothetical protein